MTRAEKSSRPPPRRSTRPPAPLRRRASSSPRREPSQLRSKERVERIVNAAADLLDRAGLAAATTNAIARKARVPIGTLYQFFPNRDAVLRALAARGLEQLHDRLQSDLAELARADDPTTLIPHVLAGLREAYVSIRGLATLVGTTQGHPELERVYGLNNRRIVQLLASVLEGRISQLRHAHAIATVIVESADGVLRHWLRARARNETTDEHLLPALEAMLAAFLRELERQPDAAEPSTKSKRRASST